MKKLRILFAIIAIFTIALMGCSTGGEGDNTVSLTILETSDVHDHAGGFGSAASYSPMVTGNDSVLGGYARLAAYVNTVRNEKGTSSVLVCDSGDFTMGTVYSMTLASSPLSFMLFSMVGFDAVTLGNHEFDLGPDALYGFITAAQANTSAPFTIPILASNLNANTSASMTALLSNGTIIRSTIIEKSGIKIGLLGQLGPNADFDSPNASPVTFDHTYADLQTQVNALRAGGAQIVVLLSHEGFTMDSGYAVGNDADIANNVTGIDVILSGHLHINQAAAKTGSSNTILVEPGAYGKYIARLDLKVDKTTGKIKSYTSTNVPIDDNIKGDQAMDYVVSQVVNPALSSALEPAFTALGLTGVHSILDTVAINDAPITDASITPGYTVGESVLGNLAADSYRTAINGIWAQAYAGSGGNVTYANNVMAAATGDANRIQIAFVPGGVIRDPLAVEAGTISFADLYNVVPLGADPLDTSAFGYPLLTTYIKGHDIYVAVGISLLMGSYQGNGDYYINFGGIYVHVTSWPSTYYVYLCPTDTNPSSPNYGINGNLRTSTAGTLIDPTDPFTTYKVAVDLYTLYMMYAVAAVNPAYTIYTYNAVGTVIVDATGNRVYTSASGTTMRGWQAMEAWAWAAGMGATSNLSNAGYTSAYPYPRVY